MLSSADVIRLLGLDPHPVEGGFFRETYRSAASWSPPGYPGPRSAGTAIYYLLTPDTYSALHTLPGDEVFHFYMGDPVRMLQLWPDGSTRIRVLGHDLAGGQEPQLVVPAGVWQGSRLVEGGRWALLGATMAPGFDYADYVEGQRGELAARYPEATEEIERLTSG